MNKLALFIFLLIGFQSFAEESEMKSTLDYSVDSVESNANLAQEHSELVVRIINSNFSEGDVILYGWGEKTSKAQLNSNKTFKFELKSGKRELQFYPSNKAGYQEITTQKIEVKSQTTTYISLNFAYQRDEPVLVKKPVIYLYPPEQTNVSVKVHPEGEFIFTYPRYEENWECTAFPSGRIEINQNEYNYLFWEANQTINKESIQKTPASIVSKDKLVAFLEKSLDQFGFNSKEKADFITFWAPQMMKHEATEIRFLINEECDQFANLDIAPKPDNLIRLYIVWSPIHEAISTNATDLGIPKQDRSGFTVLEWGGMEINTSANSTHAEVLE